MFGAKDDVGKANDAFKSPTQLTARFNQRSPLRGGGSPPPASSAGSNPSSPNKAATCITPIMEGSELAIPSLNSDAGSSKPQQTEDAKNLWASSGLNITTRSQSPSAASGSAGEASTPKRSSLPPKINTDINLDDVASTASKAKNASPSSGNLNLQHNDNAFHVVANLVLDRFQSKLQPGATSFTLTEDDRKYLDQMLQPSVRLAFVKAVQYRLAENCPPDSEAHIHVLTRRCRELGLDREGDNNPLLASLSPHDGDKPIMNLDPALGMSKDESIDTRLTGFSKHVVGGVTISAGASGTPFGGRPPLPSNLPTTGGLLTTEEENSLLRAQLEQQQKLNEDKDQRSVMAESVDGPPLSPSSRPRLIDDNGSVIGSVAGSVLTGMSEVHATNTESLARQQLMQELREASNLMAESVTPEAAKFWRQHVVELQARLRALYGEEGERGAPGSRQKSKMKLEKTLEESTMDGSDKSSNNENNPESSSEQKEKTQQEGSKEQEGSQGSQQQEAQLEMERSSHSEENARTSPQTAPVPFPGGQDTNSGLPMVDVIAPADLPGGYHFEAEIEGQRFLATVPAGGVQKGETFSCIMRDLETVGAETPVGRWRDGVCDINENGNTHPTVFMSFFCPLILLAQVMVRLKYDFLGRPMVKQNTSSSIDTVKTIITFWAVMNILIFCGYNIKWYKGFELSIADMVAIVILNFSMLVYAIYATTTVRANLREEYVIREKRCYDLEDFCCATFCMPCTVSQMARHTADYKHEEAACFSKNGLKVDHQTENTDKQNGNYESPPV